MQKQSVTKFDRSVFESPSSFVFLVCGLASLLFFCHGHPGFFINHTTHLPFLYFLEDPTLFSRDWYMQSFAPIQLRLFHLKLLEFTSMAVGLPWALIILSFGCYAALFAAFLAISRSLFLSIGPGVIFGVLVIWFRGLELGSNSFYDIFIPKSVALPMVFWSLYLILQKRVRFAGILLGCSCFFQPAFALQYSVPLTIWLLLPGSPLSRRQIFTLLAFFIPIAVLRLLLLQGQYFGPTGLSDETQIQLAAYLRHPHHMIPSYWPAWSRRWIFIACALPFYLSYWLLSLRSDPKLKHWGYLALITGILLAVATIFIEIFPIKSLILFQPFRSSLLIYLVILMLLGHRLYLSFIDGSYWSQARVLLWISGITHFPTLIALLLVETLVVILERRVLKIHSAIYAALAALLYLCTRVYFEIESLEYSLYWLAGISTLTFLIRQPKLQKIKLIKVAMLGPTVCAVLFICWLQTSSFLKDCSKGDNFSSQTCNRIAYKFRTSKTPLTVVERLGTWAHDNTERDALFMIPPKMHGDGFRLWSKRSVLFTTKFFPYNPAGLVKWQKLLFEMYGVSDLESPDGAEVVDKIFSDYGLKDVNRAFHALSAEQILDLADRYEVNYIVTGKPLLSKRLRVAKFEPSNVYKKSNKLVFVYQVVS